MILVDATSSNLSFVSKGEAENNKGTLSPKQTDKATKCMTITRKKLPKG